MPEVSPNGGVGPWVKPRGQVFVRVNQVLVRLWALPSQSLTGRFGVPAMEWCSEATVVC